MTKNASNISFATAVVNLLSNKGVKHACISPGSRNTPLTYAFLKHSKINCLSQIDERSGGFFGLGISKTSDSPVAVLTTSGTATANLMPAIIEAELSRSTLIILTADRPHSLVNTGATQTINQDNLYGKHVRAMLDIDHKKIKPTTLLKKIDTLFDFNHTIPGPIHLNFRFDLPLFDFKKKNISISFKKNKLKNKSKTYTLPRFNKPLIICGPLDVETSTTNIIKLSKKINAPIFSDSLSQLRHKGLAYYDHYINKIKKPDIILRFGRKPTSVNTNKFLDKNKKITHLFDQYGSHNDDCKNIFKTDYKNILSSIKTTDKGDNNWIKHIIDFESKAFDIINENVNRNNTQANLIRSVLSKMNKNDYIFIGNSSPIRMLDQFSGIFKTKLKIIGNYISRGIDGCTSTALGMSYVNKKTNNLLITGDISLFYDSNAFHILNKINLTIIVINNDGGQIFSRLPYSKNKIKDFKKFWITPVKTKIKDLAKLFHIKYYNYTILQTAKNINSILSLRGIKIIEVVINNNQDTKFLKMISKDFSYLK